MDKYALDLALSAGRHAVERARLAGIRRLIAALEPCLTALPTSASDMDPATVYRALQQLHPAIAVLVGICLSAAQIGMPLRIEGRATGCAAQLAKCINPSIEPWLRVLAAP